MRYRVYVNIEGWKKHDAEPSTLEAAITILDGFVSNGIEEFIVVESSKENGDFPIISTMRSYLNIKENMEKQKVLRLGRNA